MTWDWYKIFNKQEFLDLDLVSKTYTIILEGIGQKDVLVTSGIELGVTYEGIFLALNLNDKNPFEFDSHAVYIDANDDVWLGVNPNEA